MTETPSPPDSPPRFLCDHMLGTLARWLRILGFDAAYPDPLEDEALVDLAAREGRIVLTRDRDLNARRAVRSLYVASDVLEEQVRQVLRDLDLEVADALSRCPLCNGVLEEVSKEAARDRVPAGVFAKQETFWRCPSCGQHYWQGSHWDRMLRQVEAYERLTREGRG